jgi:hypothetical protein
MSRSRSVVDEDGLRELTSQARAVGMLLYRASLGEDPELVARDRVSVNTSGTT